ncbi:hypothetical protein B0H14DRAFT_2619960 [Mycena olivaceomarginata]|nr:hypothetical protein B0H14DRAFT_2619960 [Mycena olivaceomarginata]
MPYSVSGLFGVRCVAVSGFREPPSSEVFFLRFLALHRRASGILLYVVVAEGAAILELLAGEDQIGEGDRNEERTRGSKKSTTQIRARRTCCRRVVSIRRRMRAACTSEAIGRQREGEREATPTPDVHAQGIEAVAVGPPSAPHRHPIPLSCRSAIHTIHYDLSPSLPLLLLCRTRLDISSAKYRVERGVVMGPGVIRRRKRGPAVQIKAFRWQGEGEVITITRTLPTDRVWCGAGAEAEAGADPQLSV